LAGRPSDYSLDLAATICARLSAGEPLVKICRDEDMPVSSTVYLWLIKHSDFSEMYVRARDEQADTLADQIIDIADDRPEVMDSVVVAHQRLRVDARKWVASKLKPKKYGDFSRAEHTGADGVPLIPSGFNVNFPSKV